ncbi:MAG: hypothetical protein HQL27_07800, partial [Candidatus Omnitrophica bacterium]|nr:hypothetical protein [Candidatus Omnitrophota bacterium]
MKKTFSLDYASASLLGRALESADDKIFISQIRWEINTTHLYSREQLEKLQPIIEIIGQALNNPLNISEWDSQWQATLKKLLPLEDIDQYFKEEKAPVQKAAAKEKPIRPDKLRVLIVRDENPLFNVLMPKRRILEHFKRNAAFDITWAESYQEARGLIEGKEFDYLLLDVVTGDTPEQRREVLEKLSGVPVIDLWTGRTFDKPVLELSGFIEEILDKVQNTFESNEPFTIISQIEQVREKQLKDYEQKYKIWLQENTRPERPTQPLRVLYFDHGERDLAAIKSNWAQITDGRKFAVDFVDNVQQANQLLSGKKYGLVVIDNYFLASAAEYTLFYSLLGNVDKIILHAGHSQQPMILDFRISVSWRGGIELAESLAAKVIEDKVRPDGFSAHELLQKLTEVEDARQKEYEENLKTWHEAHPYPFLPEKLRVLYFDHARNDLTEVETQWKRLPQNVNYEVVFVSDLESAIEELDAREVDLVIVDANYGGGSGQREKFMKQLNRVPYIKIHSGGSGPSDIFKGNGATQEILARTEVQRETEDYANNIRFLLNDLSSYRSLQEAEHAEEEAEWKALFGLTEPGKLRVLYVEDDKIQREQLLEGLNLDLGDVFVSDQAGTFEEAIKKMEKNEYDLVIFDRNMLDSQELLEAFIGLLNNVTYVIYLSGMLLADTEKQLLIKQRGPENFMAFDKPLYRERREQFNKNIEGFINDRKRRYEDAREEFARAYPHLAPQKEIPPPEYPETLNVLLVEDEFEAQVSFRKDFVKANRAANRYKLTWAKTKKEALALMQKEPFDLVFFDIALPVGGAKEENEKINAAYYAKLRTIKNLRILTGGTYSDAEKELLPFFPDGIDAMYMARQEEDEEDIALKLSSAYESKLADYRRNLREWVAKTKPKHSGKLRVLLVDDAAEEIMEQFKFDPSFKDQIDIQVVATVEEAVELMGKNKFDIAFCDVELPGIFSVYDHDSLDEQSRSTIKQYYQLLLEMDQVFIFSGNIDGESARKFQSNLQNKAKLIERLDMVIGVGRFLSEAREGTLEKYRQQLRDWLIKNLPKKKQGEQDAEYQQRVLRFIEDVREAIRSATGFKPRVLYLEDDESMSYQFKLLLQPAAEVTPVGTFGEAIEALKQNDFDILIYDIRSPGLDKRPEFDLLAAKVPNRLIFSGAEPSELAKEKDTAYSKRNVNAPLEIYRKVESIREGMSSLAQAELEAFDDVLAETLRPKRDKINVLYVNDNQHLRKPYVEHIKLFSGPDVKEWVHLEDAGSYSHALELLAKNKFDAVMFDLRVPGSPEERNEFFSAIKDIPVIGWETAGAENPENYVPANVLQHMKEKARLFVNVSGRLAAKIDFVMTEYQRKKEEFDTKMGRWNKLISADREVTQTVFVIGDSTTTGRIAINIKAKAGANANRIQIIEIGSMDALERALKRSSPDLVITDTALGGENKLEEILSLIRHPGGVQKNVIPAQAGISSKDSGTAAGMTEGGVIAAAEGGTPRDDGEHLPRFIIYSREAELMDKNGPLFSGINVVGIISKPFHIAPVIDKAAEELGLAADPAMLGELPQPWSGDILQYLHMDAEKFEKMILGLKKVSLLTDLPAAEQTEIAEFKKVLPELAALHFNARSEAMEALDCFQYAPWAMERMKPFHFKAKLIKRNNLSALNGREEIHYYVQVNIAGYDFIVDITADQYAIKANSAKLYGGEKYHDLGVVVMPVAALSGTELYMYTTGEEEIRAAYGYGLNPGDYSRLINFWLNGFAARSKPGGVAIEDVNSLTWMPSKELFPTGADGRNRPLTSEEFDYILSQTVAELGKKGLLANKSAAGEALKEFTLEQLLVRPTTGHSEDSDLRRTLHWLWANMAITDDKIAKDYPKSRVISVARDGLVLPVSKFYRQGEKPRGAQAVYWPGQNSARHLSKSTNLQAKRAFLRMQEETNLLAESVRHKALIATENMHSSNHRRQEIVKQFCSGFQYRLEQFRPFLDWIEPQIKALELTEDQPVVIFDTLGSGKSALLVAAAINYFYPDINLDALMFSSFTDSIAKKNVFPSLAKEYSLGEFYPMDFSWSFTFRDVDAGLNPVFGQDGIHSFLSTQALILLSYNRALSLSKPEAGAFNLAGVKRNFRAGIKDSSFALNFLFGASKEEVNDRSMLSDETKNEYMQNILAQAEALPDYPKVSNFTDDEGNPVVVLKNFDSYVTVAKIDSTRVLIYRFDERKALLVKEALPMNDHQNNLSLLPVLKALRNVRADALRSHLDNMIDEISIDALQYVKTPAKETYWGAKSSTSKAWHFEAYNQIISALFPDRENKPLNVLDISSSIGINDITLAEALAPSDYKLVSADLINTLRLVCQGNTRAIFDSYRRIVQLVVDGQVYYPILGFRDKDRATMLGIVGQMEELYEDNKYVEFERTSPKLEDYIDKNPGKISRGQYDIFDPNLPKEQFDLAFSFNLISYFEGSEREILEA